ncbi:MAG: hypothetical protein M1839_004038 [Geoglossum umbratile]|nr:MAG: hypothetical protein M1839_004038 [Geoglossum umbratile]
MSPSALEAKFREYVAAWNTHDFDKFSQYWAEDFHCHWPACPPMYGRETVLPLLRGGLAYMRETLHPTFLVCSDRFLAMESRTHVEVLQDMQDPFPFDGKIYKKGEAFVYSVIVHYEYNDDLLITTFRAFGEVLKPDGGEGVQRTVLPGFDPIPETISLQVSGSETSGGTTV